MIRWAIATIIAIALQTGAAQAAVKQLTIVHNTAKSEITVRYPHMGVKAIDDQIAAWAKAYAARFAADAGAKPPEESPWNTDVTYKITRNDAQMFEAMFTLYTFTGGAHPNIEQVSLNYLVSDGYQFDLVDIVGHAGIAKVSEFAIASLTREIGSGSYDPMTSDDMIQDGAGPKAGNFKIFALTRTSLILYFDPYSVAAYAAGPQEATIPLSKLRGVIRADWRTPLPSFDCTKARTPVEKAICANGQLARLDRQVTAHYEHDLDYAALAGTQDGPAIKAAQQAFIVNRDKTCGHASAIAQCLMAAYRARLAAMEKAEGE